MALKQEAEEAEDQVRLSYAVLHRMLGSPVWVGAQFIPLLQPRRASNRRSSARVSQEESASAPPAEGEATAESQAGVSFPLASAPIMPARS